MNKVSGYCLRTRSTWLTRRRSKKPQSTDLYNLWLHWRPKTTQTSLSSLSRTPAMNRLRFWCAKWLSIVSANNRTNLLSNNSESPWMQQNLWLRVRLKIQAHNQESLSLERLYCRKWLWSKATNRSWSLLPKKPTLRAAPTPLSLAKIFMVSKTTCPCTCSIWIGMIPKRKAAPSKTSSETARHEEDPHLQIDIRLPFRRWTNWTRKNAEKRFTSRME